MGNLFWLLGLGHNAPALMVLYADTKGGGLDQRALSTINALAVVCNAAIGATSVLSIAIIWSALMRRAAWAFWFLTAGLLLLQSARWISDSLFYHQGLLANLASSLPLLAGIACAAIGLFHKTS